MKILTANAIQYRIVRKIADGGMGSVYEAIQDGVDGFTKTVAIKTLLPQLSSESRHVEMFIHEAKLVANLVHENIVQIYQLGRSPEGYYIVMEYVHGLSLHEFLRFHRITGMTVPTQLAVFMAARIARGLAYAHTRAGIDNVPLDIVHRDVCPNNIMITAEGLPKLTDFGIAVVSSAVSLDPENTVVGKLTFMSPEHATNQRVTHQSDIFALGAVLFEMLAQEPIRRGEDQADLLLKAQEGYVDWAALPDDLPEAIIHILRHCLAIDACDRYEVTQDLARDLEYFIYKDGYGPTIQTLEDYLRREFPYLYQANKAKAQQIHDMDKTMVSKSQIMATLIMETPETRDN